MEHEEDRCDVGMRWRPAVFRMMPCARGIPRGAPGHRPAQPRVIIAGSRGCYQNRYGIMPLQPHGGSYPGAWYNPNGNTGGRDTCMAVGVGSGNGLIMSGHTQGRPNLTRLLARFAGCCHRRRAVTR